MIINNELIMPKNYCDSLIRCLLNNDKVVKDKVVKNERLDTFKVELKDMIYKSIISNVDDMTTYKLIKLFKEIHNAKINNFISRILESKNMKSKDRLLRLNDLDIFINIFKERKRREIFN